MFGFGIAALLVGAAMFLFGLVGDTTVASGVSGARTYNIGLVSQQAVFVTGGGGVMIVGAIFATGALLLRKLDDIKGAVDRQNGVPTIEASPARMRDQAASAPPPPPPDLATSLFAPAMSGTERDDVRFVDDPVAWASVVEEATRQGWAAEKTPTGMRFRQSTGLQVYAKKPADMNSRLGL
jgi:hypothetical protein